MNLTKKMKVAFVSGMQSFPWGGSEILWARAAKKLVSRGCAVHSSVHHWPVPSDPINELRQAGVCVVPRVNTQYGFRSRFLKKLESAILSRSRTITGYPVSEYELKRFAADVGCISHGGCICGLTWMKWFKNNGIPYISIAQANTESWWPTADFAEVVRDVYLSADKAVFVSRANLELFERQIGCHLPNAVILRNPVQLNSMASVPWPDGNELRLACVARLEAAAKGQDLILQVLSIPKWKNRDISVSFFGSGPNKDCLFRLSKLLDVADKVDFAGQVKDVREVWKNHHAIVLPSRYEGLPLAVVEAMICGRMAIVTDVAGNTEVVRDEVNGFVAESPSVKHLDDALERAWRRQNEWESMGLTARQELLPRYEIPAEEDLVDLIVQTAKS
jgi:glycosyltransferase involved in cell wall biosynthesis